MSPTAELLLPDSTATTLAPAERAAAERMLTELWRTTVNRLTALSIELHSRADDPADPVVADLDAQLASLRHTMTEVEDALRRLR